MRDPYAPRLDWIDGGSLTWAQWKARHGGGPLSWLRYEFGAHDQDEIREAHHEDMVLKGEAHVYRGIYYGARP